MTDANPKRAWWRVVVGVLVGGAVGAAAFRQPPAEPPAVATEVPVVVAEPVAATEPPAADKVLRIPPGQHMYSVSIGCPVARAGLVEPGARVDVMATVRVGGVPRTAMAFQDALVLAVDVTGLPPVPVYSFAVTRRQALVLELVRAKGAEFSLVPVAADAKPRPPQDLDATAKAFDDPPAQPPAAQPPAADAVPPAGLVLPKGAQAFALEFPPSAAQATGFILPGGRVDLLATVRDGKTLKAFPALVNVLVVAVDAASEPNRGVTKFTVTFAVDKAQAAVLELAKARACVLSPLLRSPDANDKDGEFDIKKVTEVLTALPSTTPPVAPLPRGK